MESQKGWFQELFQKYSDCLGEEEILCTKQDFFYVSDVDTYELLHVSAENPGEINPSFRDYKGRKCYEVLQGRSDPCPFCTNSILREDRYHIWIYRNPVIQRKYLLKDILVDWKGRTARMEVVIDVDNPERMEEMLLENTKSRTMLLDCASFLLRADSLQSGLQDVVATITGFFEADGGCIQVFDQQLEACFFEKDFSIQPKRPDKATLRSWKESQVSGRILYIGDMATSRLSQEMKDFYMGNNVHRLTIVPIFLDRRVVGGIGIYNPRQHLAELAQLDVHAAWIGRMVNSFGLKDSVARLQTYDALLGCYNFEGFRRKSAELVAQNRQRKYAVICYDVREFRGINERFGLETGDALLCYLSASIGNTLRDGEINGRIGADHICVLRWYEAEEELSGRFNWIITLLNRFTELYQLPFQPEVVSGVRLLQGMLDINRALDDADTALKVGKRSPGNQLVVFSADIRSRIARESTIGQSLRFAMETGEITVHFQPQYRYSTGELVGMEALARWNSAELGRIGPDEFIPVLENRGMIYELDKFIWEQVCRQIRSWRDQGLELPSISVNVSRLDIHKPTLLADLLALVARYELETHSLHLEITETAYADAQDELIAKVRSLQEAGFVVEMDDFGKGYSSLNVLGDVPVEILKLDIRFLDMSGDTGRRGSILGSIVRMARWMDLPVIAEGVESRAQAEFLKSVGCDLMQGFYFARPMPVDEVEKLLGERQSCTPVVEVAPLGILDAMEFLDPASKTSLLFENMGAAAVIEYADEQVDALMTNDAFYRLFEVDRSESSPYLRRMLDLLASPSRERFLCAIKSAVEQGDNAYEGQMSPARKGDKSRWLSVSLRLLSSNQNRHILLLQMRDITQQKDASRELQRHQEMLRILSQNPGFSTFEYDPVEDIMYFHLNHPDRGMMYLRGEQYLASYLQDTARVPGESKEALRRMLEEAAQKPGSMTREIRLSLYKEESRLCRVHYISLANESGQVYSVVGRVDDMEEELRRRQAAAEDARLEAMRDVLTGAWNRQAMEERVNAHLARSQQGGMLLFDMDDLRQINQLYGHLAGDDILQDFASMLRKLLDDNVEIGRIAGDEFAVFLPDASDGVRVENLAEMLLRSMGTFQRSAGGVAGASCGIAMVEEDMEDFRLLFLRADWAMEQAKLAGKARAVRYQQEVGTGMALPPVLRKASELPNYARTLAADAFQLLFRAENDAEGIHQAMAHIGNWLDVSRVYIFENDPGNESLSNTFEWCSSEVSPQKDSLQRIPFAKLGDYYDNFDENGSFLCCDIQTLAEGPRLVLERQGIQAVLQYGLRKDGKYWGLIGFDECRLDRCWTEDQADTLVRTAEVLSLFLSRLRGEQ